MELICTNGIRDSGTKFKCFSFAMTINTRMTFSSVPLGLHFVRNYNLNYERTTGQVTIWLTTDECLTVTTDGSKRTNYITSLHSQKHHGLTDRRPITSRRNWPIRSVTINCCDTTHFDSEDDYRTGCRNVSYCQQQQSYSGLSSPVRSNSTYF